MRLILQPSAGLPGDNVELLFAVRESDGNFSSLQILIAGSPLGRPVAVSGSAFAVHRTIPDLPPGTYEVTAVSDGEVVATADFEVLDQTQAGSNPAVLLGLATVLASIGWRAVRGFYRSYEDWETMGLADAWYSWRARRRS